MDGLLGLLGGPLFGVVDLLQSLDANLQIVSEATCLLLMELTKTLAPGPSGVYSLVAPSAVSLASYLLPVLILAYGSSLL